MTAANEQGHTGVEWGVQIPLDHAGGAVHFIPADDLADAERVCRMWPKAEPVIVRRNVGPWTPSSSASGVDS